MQNITFTNLYLISVTGQTDAITACE